MLVISLKEGERAFLNVNGIEIKVMVTRTNLKVAKLGFDAPAEVEVHRENAKNKKKKN